MCVSPCFDTIGTLRTFRHRLEQQAKEAERERQQLETQHAADIGEARGLARELREQLAASEAEAARSAAEAG